VYENREQVVMDKLAKKDENKKQQAMEKTLIDTEVARQTQIYDEKQLAAAEARKAHQTDILKQVTEKERAMRRDL
jgi:hypothetical protein